MPSRRLWADVLFFTESHSKLSPSWQGPRSMAHKHVPKRGFNDKNSPVSQAPLLALLTPFFTSVAAIKKILVVLSVKRILNMGKSQKSPSKSSRAAIPLELLKTSKLKVLNQEQRNLADRRLGKTHRRGICQTVLYLAGEALQRPRCTGLPTRCRVRNYAAAVDRNGPRADSIYDPDDGQNLQLHDQSKENNAQFCRLARRRPWPLDWRLTGPRCAFVFTR